MKTIYRLLITSLILSNVAFAQKKQLLNDVLKVDGQTQLNIHLENAFVKLEASPDNDIYVNYFIEFKNYDVTDIRPILEAISTEVVKNENSYDLRIKSATKMSSKVYSLESAFGLTLDKAFMTSDHKKRKFKKSKGGLIKTAAFDESKAESFLEMLQQYKDDGTTEKVDLETLKSYQVNFIIKLPKHLYVDILSKQSELVFKTEITNPITCEAAFSTIRSDGFLNKSNVFKMKNGRFKVVTVSGGRYAFKDTEEVIIGSLDNAIVNSEFSEFSIGEIGQNVIINDFNSDLWLYNFSKQMGGFIVNSEYSKVNVYYPEDRSNFLLSTMGYATIHYTDNAIFEIPPSKKKEPTKMLVFGNQDDAVLNKITINIVNGIVRLGKDFIDIND